MKFSIPFISHKKTSAPKKFRVDARRYWVFLLSGFVLILAAELIYFSTIFMHTSERIEAPASPTLETNDLKIRRMQTKLKAVEDAIQNRTGAPSSQNNSPVVQ
jgi:hypothetical protein